MLNDVKCPKCGNVKKDIYKKGNSFTEEDCRICSWKIMEEKEKKIWVDVKDTFEEIDVIFYRLGNIIKIEEEFMTTAAKDFSEIYQPWQLEDEHIITNPILFSKKHDRINELKDKINKIKELLNKNMDGVY